MSQRLQGKTAFITAAGQGIGRAIAEAFVREGATVIGLLPVVPHPPEQPSKLARDIQKAGQPDCREAYGALGLLAVVPLVADSVRDKGCRW